MSKDTFDKEDLIALADWMNEQDIRYQTDGMFAIDHMPFSAAELIDIFIKETDLRCYIF